VIARLRAWNERRRAANRPPTLSLNVRPRSIKCPCCKQTVTAWRRYASGRMECIECADKPKRRK